MKKSLISIIAASLLSVPSISFASEPVRLSKFADAFAGLSVNGLPLLGTTIDKNSNPVGTDKNLITGVFKKMATDKGIQLKEFGSIEKPFLRLKFSNQIANGSVTFNITVQLVELVEIERRGERYQTLAPIWMSSYNAICPANDSLYEQGLINGIEDGIINLLKAIQSASLPEHNQN